MALALRPSRKPAVSLQRSSAHRSGALVRIELGALTPMEARELLGATVRPADADVIYEESGGNAFYLEQLARSLDRAGGRTPSSGLLPSDIGVPAAVAASLSEELGMLSENGRVVFEGAAVAGDPFEAELAAAAAAMTEAATMDALDELLRLDLVRATEVPRRFRFRHPLIRRAAYDGTAAAWRGCTRAVRRGARCKGAPAAARAHHVERSARQGDPPQSRSFEMPARQQHGAPPKCCLVVRRGAAIAPGRRAGGGTRRAHGRARPALAAAGEFTQP